jgi:hypothetical protein
MEVTGRFILGEITLGTNLVGSPVGPRAGLDAMQERKTSLLQGNIKKKEKT